MVRFDGPTVIILKLIRLFIAFVGLNLSDCDSSVLPSPLLWRPSLPHNCEVKS